MHVRWRVIAAVLAGLVCVSSAASQVGASARPDPAHPASGAPVAWQDGFGSLPVGPEWQDGHAYGGWRSQFDGWGTTAVKDVAGRPVLSQRPRPATQVDGTDASLVTSTREFGDLDLRVRLRTVDQLRTPEPNPWEVAWVIWHYTDNTHFYYLALKPNGWELGKEDPAYPGAQRFLATGSTPRFPVGAWYDVRVRQVGDATTVWVDGLRLTAHRDTERPYRRGAVGLYNEDADVQFRDVSVAPR